MWTFSRYNYYIINFNVIRNVLLINQIVAIVMEKKCSWSILTFTKMAVRMKSSNMKTMLPAMRIFSAILHKKKDLKKYNNNISYYNIRGC